MNPKRLNAMIATWTARTRSARGASSAALSSNRMLLGRMLLGPGGDLGVGCEPHVRPGADVPDQLLDDPGARAVADDVRVHGQLEDAALLVGGIELAAEDVVDIGRRGVGAQA